MPGRLQLELLLSGSVPRQVDQGVQPGGGAGQPKVGKAGLQGLSQLVAAVTVNGAHPADVPVECARSQHLGQGELLQDAGAAIEVMLGVGEGSAD
jgi:hypothetical protein